MLFKILRGPSSRISKDKTEFHDGYVYFTPDDGGFYIDAEDTDTGAQNRIRVNPVMEHQDISGLLNKTGDASNTTATFTAPSARENIKTGEKLSVIMGKIAKWFSSLGTLAFKSSVAKSDLAADVQTSLGKADTVPTKVSELTNDANYITADQAPVQSVNNKTGAVSLTASDVGAVSKTGDTMAGNLTVGSASLQTNGYVTGTWLKTTANIASSSAASKIAVINDGWVYSRTTEQIKSDIGLGNVDNVKQYSATNPPPYPVTSVNSKTGAVTLSAIDVSAIPSTLTGTAGQVLTKTPDGQEWKDAAEETVIVKFTGLKDNDSGTLTCDKTYSEIQKLADSTKQILAKVHRDYDEATGLPDADYVLSLGLSGVMDGICFIGGENGKQLVVYSYNSETWNYDFTRIASIPRTSAILKGSGSGGVSAAVPGTDYMAPIPVTASDNGKFLRVVSGAWAAVEIANANGGSF